MFRLFSLGGLILASGLSQPFFLVYVEDERYNLPLTLVYIALGYGGLALGFLIPFGKNIGDKIQSETADWKWNPENVLLPGILLLMLSVLATVLSLSVYGILGYQKVDEIGAYDGLIFLLTLFWLEASFLLWISIFKVKKLNINHFLIIALLLITSDDQIRFSGKSRKFVSSFYFNCLRFYIFR